MMSIKRSLNEKRNREIREGARASQRAINRTTDKLGSCRERLLREGKATGNDRTGLQHRKQLVVCIRAVESYIERLRGISYKLELMQNLMDVVAVTGQSVGVFEMMNKNAGKIAVAINRKLDNGKIDVDSLDDAMASVDEFTTVLDRELATLAPTEDMSDDSVNEFFADTTTSNALGIDDEVLNRAIDEEGGVI